MSEVSGREVLLGELDPMSPHRERAVGDTPPRLEWNSVTGARLEPVG